jgi:pimeloyl-ACP methyl ester carboxylesterase
MTTTTSADGTTIDFERWGDGDDAVILIGGATQFRAMDPQTDRIAELVAEQGFTAVVYDRRGRGGSGDTPPWSLDREVEDVTALIQQVGGRSALYSSSSGAAVALAAATASVGVTALALYEPPFFAGQSQQGDLDELHRLLAADDRDGAMRWNMQHVIGLPAEMVEGMSHAPWWANSLTVAPTLVYDLQTVHDINTDPDWQARWAGVTVPTVVYSGDQTFPGLPDAADAVAAAIPQASRRVLAGQGHGPAPEAIAPELVEFLRTVPTAAV